MLSTESRTGTVGVFTEPRRACVIALTTESRFAANSAAAERGAALSVSILSEVIVLIVFRNSVLADCRAACRSASAACRSSRTQVRYVAKVSSMVEAMVDETAEAMDSLMSGLAGRPGL